MSQAIAERVAALLTEEVGHGAGNCFADYDDGTAVLRVAVAAVEAADDLCQGCGVGPLMPHIRAWVAAFEAAGT